VSVQEGVCVCATVGGRGISVCRAYFVPATQTIQEFSKLFPTVIPNEKMYLAHVRQLAKSLHGQASHSHSAVTFACALFE
jgi:hypothetical protein